MTKTTDFPRLRTEFRIALWNRDLPTWASTVIRGQYHINSEENSDYKPAESGSSKISMSASEYKALAMLI